MKRLLLLTVALAFSTICVDAELFVVKMNLQVRVVDPSSGNLSNVTLIASNLVEATGEDPTTATLVVDSSNFGSMLIVDNQTGDTLQDFASESTTGSACAINAFGTKTYCQAFLDFFGGTTASAIGPIDSRADSATGKVLRYNWSAKIQGNLDATTYGLPSVSVGQTSVPFVGNFTSLRRFVPTSVAPCSLPTASTGGAGIVTNTTATVSGSINPNGLATTVIFQYGTNTTYGSSTASQSVGSGTTITNVTADLSVLLPAQTYHYQISATSSCGTVNGSDQTFTTTGP